MRFRLPLACSLLLIAAVPSAHHSQYLFTWAMETRDPADTMPAASTMGDDVLAVFDVSPDASPFGKLVGFLTTGSKAKMAHRTNYVLPSDDVLYANDWMGNSTFAFDLNDATHPGVERRFASVGKYSYPHASAYLSNGNTPIVAGNYLVLAAQSGHAPVSLDMRDPAHPHEVSRLTLAGDEYPHWLATHVRFAAIDPDTGTLALDPESIDMKRAWPDGWNGAAVPHGSVLATIS